MSLIVKKKNSNIELLRIIAMFLIVAYHLAIYLDINLSDLKAINKYGMLFLSLGGKVGVHIFILITGFYSINKTDFPKDRLLLLFTRVTLWSLSIQLVYILCSGLSYSNVEVYKGLVLSLVPLFSDKWWFVTAYMLLMILSPILNISLQNLTETQFRKYLWSGIFLCFALPTISVGKLGYVKYIDPLLLFVLIYSIGGYFARFGCRLPSKKILSITLGTYLLFFIIVSGTGSFGIYFRDQTSSLLCLIIASGLFWLFQTASVKSNQTIVLLGHYTLDIYLLSDHEWIRSILYPFLTPYLIQYQYSVNFIPICLIIAIVIMVIGFIFGVLIQAISLYILCMVRKIACNFELSL